MPTFPELRELARQRLSAELGTPCTPEDVAKLCDVLALFALSGGAPPPVSAHAAHPAIMRLFEAIPPTFGPLIAQLQAELARVTAEARRRDLGPDEAEKFARVRLWNEFVVPPQEWAKRDLPRLSLRQIRARVDRVSSQLPGLTAEGRRNFRKLIFHAAVEEPSGVTAVLGHPATWHDGVTNWVESLPWRCGAEMELLRRAVSRLIRQAHARGKRGGQIDREVARRVDREFIGVKGS